MPADFMEAEDPEVVVQTIMAQVDGVTNEPEPDGTGVQTYDLTCGEFRLHYLGGSMLFCEHNDANNCSSSTARSLCSVFHTVWSESRTPLSSFNVASFNGSGSYGLTVSEVGSIPATQCLNGAGLQTTVEATAAGLPDVTFVLEPIIGQPLLSALSHTFSGDAWFANNYHTCGGQAGGADATNNTTFQIIKQRRFIDQPVRYIDAWTTVRTLITPADAIAQVWPGSDPWTSGDFDEEAIRRHYDAWGAFSPSVTYQFNDVYNPLVWLREPTIGGGWVNCRRSVITTALGPTGFWQLSIWGEYTNSHPFFPNQANILWRGRKYKGTTAAGAYCWVSSYDPALETLLPCVVLL
jgi:hypothetical protein